MKRSQSDSNITSRVYSFGSVPPRIAPVLGEPEAQLKLAHRLWNLLVAIDRRRIDRYRKIMHDEAQERMEALKEQISGLRAAIKGARREARRRSLGFPDQKQALGLARTEMSALIARQKESALERHALRKVELEALNAATKRRIVRARQAAASMGLFWGTYNDIIQRADTARKLGEMQFRRFSADGTLTAQIIGGATVAQCISTPDRAAWHTFFQIDSPVPGRKWRRARMRIGSDSDRQPIWLDVPVVYHRDIPETTLIKSVSMTRRAGRWQLNVTVNLARPTERSGMHALAVDIGWRLLPHGVRVAYWADDRSDHAGVVVPAADIRELERVHSLRSTCDRLRDEFLPALCAWLDGRELADEWKRQTVALSQWRSSDRIAGLVRWWADNRLVGDEEIFEAARVWRTQYLHFANWWRNLESQMRLRIRDQYRRFASWVASEYDALYIEDFDLREVAKTPAPESAESSTAASGYRQMVSPSVFRAALINACRREGVRVVKVESAYTTRECHVCGAVEQWDQRVEIVHRCKCGMLWDQDHNAAINLLRAGIASGGASPTKNQSDGGAISQDLEDRSQEASEGFEQLVIYR
jgi:hypothetical protein